jgi:hypothetical protein
MEEIAEQSETLVMMRLSGGGFLAWLEEGEDIYDAEAQELMGETERRRSGEDKGETEKDEKTGGHISRCTEFFGSARALPSRKTTLNLLPSTMVKGKIKMVTDDGDFLRDYFGAQHLERRGADRTDREGGHWGNHVGFTRLASRAVAISRHPTPVSSLRKRGNCGTRGSLWS